MSIPLIQKPEKDDINTSIIAIKRNIERINMLLGLVDSGDPDLSGLATKQELQDAITELTPVDEVAVDNMHSVSSNAVANCLEYPLQREVFTGEMYRGKKVYRYVDTWSLTLLTTGNSNHTFQSSIYSTFVDILDFKLIRPAQAGTSIYPAVLSYSIRFVPSTKQLTIYGVTTEWSGPFIMIWKYTKT